MKQWRPLTRGRREIGIGKLGPRHHLQSPGTLPPLGRQAGATLPGTSSRGLAPRGGLQYPRATARTRTRPCHVTFLPRHADTARGELSRAMHLGAGLDPRAGVFDGCLRLPPGAFWSKLPATGNSKSFLQVEKFTRRGTWCRWRWQRRKRHGRPCRGRWRA